MVLLASLLLHSHDTFAQHDRLLREADEQYNLFNYSKAIPLYQQLYKTDSTTVIAQKLANSYRMVQDYRNAETWYAKATAVHYPNAEDVLRYAQVLQNNAKYPEAKKQFIKYYAQSPPTDQKQLSVLLASCDSAIAWMKDPRPFVITNETGLNGRTSDWGAVKYNNSVVFVSDRIIQKPKNRAWLRFDMDKAIDKERYLWTGNDYLRLYQAPSGAETALFPIKTIRGDYHVGPAAFTADGNEMYFTLTRVSKTQTKDTAVIKTIKPGIFYSKKTANGAWGKPQPFAYNNELYSTGDPFITPDGKALYFVSDMVGGKGGTDIYYCKRGANDSWEKPVNLAAVNTAGNERTPVLYAGKLYFSSDDNTGMGGLDVYMAEAKGNSFGKALNMGYPVNSPQDDFAFMPTGATTGYLSSNRQGGAGSDDIYSYVQKAAPTYAFVGMVYDKQSQQPIANSTVILRNTNGKVQSVQTDLSGKFGFILDEKSNYLLRVESERYYGYNESITTVGADVKAGIRKSLYLTKTVSDKPVRLEHVHYNFDASAPNDETVAELVALIKILKDNPAARIEINAYTDSRGSNTENMERSQYLAETVAKYIIDNGGIAPDRLKARGYGATQLLNGCKVGVKCTEAEHLANQRVEYTITGM